MARLQWIKQRLDNWARWARERESGSLGYPKQSAFMRMTPSGGGFTFNHDYINHLKKKM